MKNFQLNGLYASLIFMLALSSGCQLRTDLQLKQGPWVPHLHHQLEEDQLLRCLSHITANLQVSEEFRSFVEGEVKKQMGKEKTLLFLPNRDHSFASGQSLKQLYHQQALALGYKVEKHFWERLFTRMPLLSLTLYLPDHIPLDHWVYDRPLSVIPVSREFEWLDGHREMAFNMDGVFQEIGNENPPTTEMLLVENNHSFLNLKSWSKREDLRDFFRQQWKQEVCEDFVDFLSRELAHASSPLILHWDEKNLLLDQWLLKEEYNYCGSREERNVYARESVADRDGREKREEIVKIKVQHSELKKFCKWWKSTCSIEVKTDFANQTTDANGNPVGQPVSEPSKFINGQRKDMKHDKEYYCYLQMFNWRFLPGIHGDPYAYNFIGRHHNPGATTKFSFNFKPQAEFRLFGVNINLSVLNTRIDHSYTTTDTHLGGDWIYYDDPANGFGTAYTTGSLTFWVKEHE